jgi:hypothetical protein
MTGETPDPFPTEADVDAVLEEFGGNPRAAIRALLHDLAALAADYEASVSKGYVRSRRCNQEPATGDMQEAPSAGAFPDPISKLRELFRGQ